MALQTAVAASLLPASRSQVATLFKELRFSFCEQAGRRPPSRGGSRAAGCPIATLRPPAKPPARCLPRRLGWASSRSPASTSAIRSCWLAFRILRLSFGFAAIQPCSPEQRWLCGSRAATDYARQVGERLGSELAGRGIVVTSGLARGVDSAAHAGCLGSKGATVAVLGCGLDRVYPAEHADLAASVSKQGALVSELGPGAPPLPEHFPLRNRIISGISLAVVVVEASEKSGSLITARYALEQGRDVMAVPGSVLSGRNRGSHGLLKDGAKVVESADDILQGLGWPSPEADGHRGRGASESDPLLSRMEAGEVYRLDELMSLTGVSGPKLLPRLMELELQGKVTARPGGFVRA